MKTERRWLKSAIAAAAQPQPALPWQRAAQAQPRPVPSPRIPPSRPTAAMAAR